MDTSTFYNLQRPQENSELTKKYVEIDSQDNLLDPMDDLTGALLLESRRIATESLDVRYDATANE